MNSRYPNFRQTWLRRLATLVVVAMLASMLPVSVLAEESRGQSWSTSQPGGKEAADADAPEGFTYEGLNFEFDHNPDVTLENKAEYDEDSEMPEYYEDEPIRETKPSAQSASQEDGEIAPEYSEENAAQEETTVDDGSAVITSFVELAQSSYNLTQKPDLQSLTESFPETVEATIEGMEDAVSFKVAWYCQDYENGDHGTYIFDPQFVDEVVVIGDREVAIGDVFLDLDVELPRIVVSVAAITGFQQIEASHTLMEKPETAEQAAQALGLPETIYGTLSDSDELQAFPVRWVCDDYDGSDVLSFTFRAEFADAEYALAEGVSMPVFQAEVAPVAAFEALPQTEYVVDQAPGSVDEAVARMNLPDTINGLPAGFVEDASYQITWDSPDFEANSSGEYTFVASFADVQYELESGVEMPEVIMKAGGETVSGDYTYTTDAAGNATITAYNSTNTEVEIPAALDGHPVIAIGANAFADKTTITSVTLPAGIETISASAFADCTALTKVTLPDSLNAVDATAFTGDTEIDTVILSVSGKNTELTALNVIEKGETTVTLPELLKVTDIEVLSGEEITMLLDCDFEVAKGHHITVEAGSVMILTQEKTLTNHGTIQAKAEGEAIGRIDNEGTIISCDVNSTVSGEIKAAAVLSHEFTQEGEKLTCAHCGLTVALKTDTATRAKLTKDYDRERKSALAASDFTVSDSKTSVSSVAANYADERVGTNKEITASIRLINDEESYTIKLTGAINPVSISDETLVTLKNISDQTYDGYEQEPEIELTYLDQAIDASQYTVVYYDNVNVGTASAVIIANENSNFDGFREAEFKIRTRSMSDVQVASIDRQLYTGKEIKPVIVAEYKDYLLVEDDDYTVVYSNNIEVGTARATLTGRGNFTGTKTVEFTIYNDTKADKTLYVRYTGDKPSKTYDGTRNISLKRSQFEFVDKPEEGDTVEITGLNAAYDSIHVGERNVNISFATRQESEQYNYILRLDETLKGTINKRDLTVTPMTSKVYGQTTTYTYRGLMSGDTLQGELTLSNEDVGTRTISAENLRTYHSGTPSNDYNIKLNSSSITISAKPINATDIAVTLVGNSNIQTYTGSPVNPVSSIRYNTSGSAFTTLVEGTDYDITYNPTDHTNVTQGTSQITATIRGRGNYSGERTVSFRIVARSIADVKVSEISDQRYTGSAITPTPTVTYGDTALKKDTDYTLTYKDNINPGTATITITGKGAYTGTQEVNFKIVKSIAHSDIKVSTISDQTHTGSAITPTPTITDGTKTLKEGTDYTLEYRNNTSVGTATITITGKGSYTGTRTVTFKIVSSSSSGSGSSSSSSSSSSSDDDDDEEEAQVTEEAHYGYQYVAESSNRYLSIDTVNQTAEYYSEADDEYLIGDFTGNLGNGITVKFRDSDKSAYVTLTTEGDYQVVSVEMDGETWEMDRIEWETVDGVIAEHRNPHIGELKVDGTYRGVVLYDEEYQPRPFAQEIQNIEGTENQRRVVIRPLPERDANNNTVYLDMEQTREKFASLHLRVNNELIETLKQLNVAELLFEYDRARIRVPLEALTPEIDLNKLYEPETDATENDADEEFVSEDAAENDADEEFVSEDAAEAEGDGGDEETVAAAPAKADIEGADEEFEEIPGGNAAADTQADEEFEEIAANEETPMAGEEDVPVLQRVDMYDFHVQQVYGNEMTANEFKGLEQMQAVTPMYRIEVNAVSGQFPKPHTEEEGEDLDDESASSEAVSAPAEYEISSTLDADGIVNRLSYVGDVGIAVAGADQVVFSLNALSSSAEFEAEDQVMADGVFGGGVIEIYADDNAANQRDSALALTDGTIFSAAHRRVGYCVIRLSSRLNETEATSIMDAISKALVSETPETVEKTIEYTLPRMFPVLRLLNLIEEADDASADAEAEAEAEADVDADVAEETEEVGQAEFTIKPLTELNQLREDAKALFASSDENAEDERAVQLTEPEFRVETYVSDNCAVFYPEAAGMYGIVQPLPASETVEPAAQPVETAAPAAEVTPAPTAAPTPTPEPVPAEDPEPMYAYNRRSNEGNMYWLVDNQAKTVEFYREDTKTYRIGDYTGSLIGGMTVQYRDNSGMGQIKLKFQQTYKFALTDVDGSELLMEQCDINNVESIMKGVR